MNTMRKLAETARNHVPAYLRNEPKDAQDADRSAEDARATEDAEQRAKKENQQAVAAATTHG